MSEKNSESLTTRHADETLGASLWARARATVVSARDDEEGANTVEVILAIFVGVIILLALVRFFFPSIWNQLKQRMNDLIQPRT